MFAIVVSGFHVRTNKVDYQSIPKILNRFKDIGCEWFCKDGFALLLQVLYYTILYYTITLLHSASLEEAMQMPTIPSYL